MRIQCSACEAAEARVLCCADEAALCFECDQKVHAANKLAGKHQRVPLLVPEPPAPRVPKCDICQEAAGYFFCLEDRALLCRKCDIAIHTANSFVSAHQRFLVTGVRVDLESTEHAVSSAKEPVNTALRITESSSKPFRKRSASPPLYGEASGAFSSQLCNNNGLVTNNVPFSSGTTPGSLTDWPLDDFFGLTDFNQNYGFTKHASKTDSGKLGSSEGSPLNLSIDENLDSEDCLGRVPEISWMVPEIPSPPTASGLHWQKNLHYPASENVVSVPDISSSPIPQRYHSAVMTKRRRYA
ncbi:Zinc finger RING/FYVE/PHD-type protein [Dioscorea alata]|uniref:Zinc finger RING/FYVE/PHD-type protein n=1 Tax=Dioscorea alata TaxID=55571 RepID=A0ACB7UBR9_DIOAL|nr:Zinc finger RING/FYVE/PHD-type protein [Dioscorea alata]